MDEDGVIFLGALYGRDRFGSILGIWHQTKLPQKIKLQILNGREIHEVHLKISNEEARNNS